jgi:plastocyanin
MQRRSLVVLTALAALATAAFAASGSFAYGHAAGATVKTFDVTKMVPNKYIQDGMHFTPGTVSVPSGGSLTFTYGDKEMEPHTLTIVKRADLPRTVAQVENCRACRVAMGHLKHPRAEPGPTNPIVHWVLNKGQPGLDAVGDSIAIQPGAHKSMTVEVSAPSGTTLYFVCAVHPWMQGKIVVR